MRDNNEVTVMRCDTKYNIDRLEMQRVLLCTIYLHRISFVCVTQQLFTS